MSNVQSYNALIDRFKAFASGHFILKTFSHGQIDTADLEKFTEYPFMHVVPSNVTYAKGTKTFSFQIVLADLPRDKDDKVEFQREVLSDLQRIAEDLVAEITNHRVLFGDLITVQNVSLEPFLEEFHNTLTGWTVSLELLVPYYWDACSIPAEWNDMFESGSGGTGSILTFIDSITRDEYGNVSLVNDEATPAPNYYYGTNDEGVRGWYLLTDEVGLTCATIGTCQTIIDIEAEIDLLQQDVTDLQADVVAIETELPNKVPYTGATGNVDLGEYELKAGQIEFDTTPTGTAGAAVMRWNDTDGTVDVGLKGGNVTLQVGQESVIRVVNKAGADLLEANYQAVRVRLVSEGGAQGQRLAVVLALADTDADSATTIGLVTETINNNQEGFVTTSGEVRGINTTGSLQGETWVDGDILYLSGTTAGRVTNIKPSAPTHTIIIGYVVYAHANNGKIFVKVDNGYELDELHNVSITTPANNEVLTYESSTSLWKNKTVETALGYTPVPTTRTLTINGTTQDLSADRTFTIATGLTVGTTPITSGTVGRVLFEGTGNVLQESANLFWDNTNGRLGIGTTAPFSTLTANGIISSGNNLNTSGGSTVQGELRSYQLGTIPLWLSLQTTTGKSGLFRSNTDYILYYDTSTGDTVVNSSFGGAALKFNLQNSEKARIFSTGNVAIGTTTDAGFKLDVNGTARVQGNAQFGTGFYWDNTNSRLGIGTASPLVSTDIRTSSNSPITPLVNVPDAATTLLIGNTGTNGVLALGQNNTSQAWIQARSRLAGASANALLLNPLGGNVLIGTTTDAGFKLDVNGTARFTGTTTFSNGDLRTNEIVPIQNGNLLISAKWADSTNVTISTITNKAQVLIVQPTANLTLASTTHDTQRITHTFAPTSGTAVVNALTLQQTINQTGGANGITRGLYINPTLTSAANFRAIETARGNIVFGNLPTSSAGLPTGALWNDAGTVKIV